MPPTPKDDGAKTADKPLSVVDKAKIQAQHHADATDTKPVTPEDNSGDRMVVVAPYVTYATLIPREDDPREMQVVQRTATKGSVLSKSDFDAENGIASEWKRLKNAHPEGRNPFVVDLPSGVSAQSIVSRPAVGAGTGTVDAQATAIRQAAELTRQGLLRHLHPDDPEYPGPKLEDALAERNRMTQVQTGPGGYHPDYDPDTA